MIGCLHVGNLVMILHISWESEDAATLPLRGVVAGDLRKEKCESRCGWHEGKEWCGIKFLVLFNLMRSALREAVAGDSNREGGSAGCNISFVGSS